MWLGLRQPQRRAIRAMLISSSSASNRSAAAVRTGAKLEQAWRYRVDGGCSGPGFVGDTQYLAAGARLHAIGGASPFGCGLSDLFR